MVAIGRGNAVTLFGRPENLENLAPLLVGKGSLPTGSVEPSVDVGQERALPSRQVLAKQRFFDVVSEFPSRVHYRRPHHRKQRMLAGRKKR
ncbi:hypothetical protein ACOJBO_25595 [Rhizobium beringeri]